MGSVAKKMCSVEGCEGQTKYRGLCNKHYVRLLKSGVKRLSVKGTNYGECSLEDCQTKATAHGLCQKHYYRNKTNGSPLAVKKCMDHGEYCTIDGCNNKYRTMGLCQLHYDRYKRHGKHMDKSLNLKRKNHHMSGTREYSIWLGMKARCSNKNLENYKYYGARNIRVCKKWLYDFEAFFEDLGKSPSYKHSIDRQNPDGHYSCGKCEECLANGWPMNCRWATSTEQANNTRRNRNVTFLNRTMSVMQWSKELDINSKVIIDRLNRGFPIDIVFSKNKLPRRSHASVITNSQSER